MADYYDALGVSRDASTQEIKQAFRRIARESHPDANPGDPVAEERFRSAAEAYEVLSDPQRRAAYDRGDTIDLNDLFSSFAGVDDLLQRFFGGGFGGFGPQARQTRGGDTAVRVVISLAEAAAGVTRLVEFDARVPCEACSGSGAEPGTDLEACERCGGGGSLRATRQTILGTTMSVVTCDRCAGHGRVPSQPCAACGGRGSVTGRRSLSVDIPPGIGDGDRLRVSSGGHAGDAGQRSGDLFVEVTVEPDPRFERHGADLVHRVTVGLSEAALGAKRTIPTVDTGDEEIDLPPGTQPGTVFKLSRRGMPRLGRRGRGDLLVEVVLEVPEALSAEQEAALREYAVASGERPAEPSRKRRRKT
jgi:molecular chaperone DnaJ